MKEKERGKREGRGRGKGIKGRTEVEEGREVVVTEKLVDT